MGKSAKREATASPPATRASKRKASGSLQSSSSSVVDRPSSSGSAVSSNARQNSTSMGPPSLPQSRASSETPSRQTRSSARSVGSAAPELSRSPSMSAVPGLSPDAEQFGSQPAANSENVASQNGDTPENVETPENLDDGAEDDGTPEIQPVRRGRPPNRGRGRGRGRGGRGRGGLIRVNSGAIMKSTPTPSTRGGYRGRGGRGKKTSSNRLVQAAYDRQKDLKAAYKAVARIVSQGLILLTDRNLEFMKDDLEFQNNQPEYQQVQAQLNQVHNQRVIELEKSNERTRLMLENKRYMAQEYEREIFKASFSFLFFLDYI